MTLTHNDSFPRLEYFTADNIHSSGLTAIFSTRNGGVSGVLPETEFLQSLNLQLHSGPDTDANIDENYRIIASSQGFRPDAVISVHQVHADRIIAVDGKMAKGREADALITNRKGFLLSVRTADCVPLLLYDSVNEAVGAVHAGWQGTFMGIAPKTVKRMGELYGTKPADVRAAIGPAIGVCCYEVDEKFHEQFFDEYKEKINPFFVQKPGRKPSCDLKAMNRAFLVEAGVLEANIETADFCTMCNPALFYSHRRSGEKRGTMAAFIGMRE